MDARYHFRQRVYSESQETSPRQKPTNRIRFIGKFPVALVSNTVDLVARRQEPQDRPGAGNSLDQSVQKILEFKHQSDMEPLTVRLPQNNRLQRIEKIGTEPKRSNEWNESRQIERRFLPDIDKIHPMGVESSNNRSPARDAPAVSSNRVLEKVNKIFWGSTLEVTRPRNLSYQANEPSKERTATPQEEPKEARGLGRYRKPLTHQDKKRHKTLETSEAIQPQLFTFYPSKKRMETQFIDNEFL